MATVEFETDRPACAATAATRLLGDLVCRPRWLICPVFY